MKMYKVSRNWLDITEIEVLRKTESSMWIISGKRERREAISTTFTTHFETFEEARDHIIKREFGRLVFGGVAQAVRAAQD